MNQAAALESVESLVSQVTEEFLDRLDRGEQPEIEEYADRYPQIAAVLRQLLPALQAVRAPREERGTAIEAPAAGPQPLGCLGDYRILREVGRGGMGVVYEAVQISLARRVALKVLPFASALDTRQLQRFKNEAQAAAHLQHQNIVPVYGVGCERGVHYYAMQFIEGQTLAALIHELRQGTGLDKQIHHRDAEGAEVTQDEPNVSPRSLRLCGESPLAPATPPVAALSTEQSTKKQAFFRTVANLGVQAAEALEHAHGLGVVHRDIKPANLIVEISSPLPASGRGAGGEGLRLWITDFGLAHCQSQAGLTMSGDLVGTLRYMSPEQALAQRVVIDHRTDVYSLGATLYELLTLEPAFAGRDRQELLRQIAFEEPKPPRKLNQAVPADLETVVLKALAKNPDERYATAQELADDLQRFLKDEPIKARRPTPVQRVRKWARRHQPVVWSAAVSAVALLLMAVIALSLGLLAVDRERQHTDEAYKDLSVQQQKTRSANDQLKANLQLALQALDELYLRLTADRSLKDPKEQKEDDELLKKALAFYERFAAQNSDDPDVRHAMSHAYRRAGLIHGALGQYAQAKQAHERAVAVAEQLSADYPQEREYRRTLGANLNDLAESRNRAGELREGEQHARRAFDLRKQLVDEFPDVAMYRRDLATAHNLLGVCLLRQGNPAEAAGHFRAYLDIQTQVIAEGLNTPQDRYQLARAHLHLGTALAPLFEPDAVEHWRKAIAIYTELVANADRDRDLPRSDRANPVTCRRDLAIAHYNVGRRLKFLGDPEAKAAEHLAESAKIQTELAADWPRVPQHRAELADTLLLLGDLLVANGKPQDAEENCRKALEHLTRLVAEHPDVGQYRDNLALCRIYLGNLCSNAGDTAGAAEHYRQAFGLIKGLVDQWPKDPKYLRCVVWNRATCLDPEFRDIDLAVKVGKQLVEEITPTDGNAWTIVGVAYYRAKDWETALDALKRADKLHKGGDGRTWIFLAMTHWQLGNAKEARHYYDLAAPRLASYGSLQRFRAEAAALLGINE